MYIQTQSSTVPLSKRCDVTYPNSSDYEAYYDISFYLSLSLSNSLPHSLVLLTRPTRVHENERKKEERRKNVRRIKTHLFSVLCCFLVECRSVLAVLVGLVFSACVSRYRRIRVESLRSWYPEGEARIYKQAE
jgi:hypothetical protein